MKRLTIYLEPDPAVEINSKSFLIFKDSSSELQNIRQLVLLDIQKDPQLKQYEKAITSQVTVQLNSETGVPVSLTGIIPLGKKLDVPFLSAVPQPAGLVPPGVFLTTFCGANVVMELSHIAKVCLEETNGPAVLVGPK